MIHLDVLAEIARGGTRRVEYVVIHTEGDGVNNDTSAAAIRAWHKTPKAKGGPGALDIMYDAWIRMNGLVELGRSLDRPSAHAKGFPRSYGIGLAGDGDIRDFTMAQYDSLFELCWVLQPRFELPWAHFIGHREVPAHGGAPTSKTCPGLKVDLPRFRAMLAEPR